MEQIGVNNGLMLTIHKDDLFFRVCDPGAVRGMIPPDLPNVKGILQNISNHPVLKGIPAIRPEAVRIQAAGNAGAVISLIEFLDDTLYDCRAIRHDSRNTVRGRCVTDRRLALVAAAHGLFCHTPADFLRQIVRVEFIRPLDNRLDQAAIHSLHDRLRDADHIDTALLPQHGLVEGTFILVPGEAGKLPYKHRLERSRFLACCGDHSLKFWATVGFLPGNSNLLGKNKFFWNNNTVYFRILQNLTFLCI